MLHMFCLRSALPAHIWPLVDAPRPPPPLQFPVWYLWRRRRRPKDHYETWSNGHLDTHTYTPQNTPFTRSTTHLRSNSIRHCVCVGVWMCVYLMPTAAHSDRSSSYKSYFTALCLARNQYTRASRIEINTRTEPREQVSIRCRSILYTYTRSCWWVWCVVIICASPSKQSCVCVCMLVRGCVFEVPEQIQVRTETDGRSCQSGC